MARTLLSKRGVEFKDGQHLSGDHIPISYKLFCVGIIPKGPRIQGFEGSSERLKNFKTKGAGKKDIAEIERMLKALIKSIENKPLDP